MPEVLNFFSELGASQIWNLSLKGFFVYIFLLWVALVIWVARDVVSRTKNLLLQVVSIVIVAVLNIFGVLIYLIIRPQKTLLERYYEELEQKTFAEAEEVCPACERPLPLKFRFCPGCGVEARVPCPKCKQLTSEAWSVCAYCGEALTAGATKKERKKK